MAQKKSEKIIESVKGLFKTDPLKLKFMDVICQQMSERTVLSLDQNELHDFILILYDFFIIKHHQKSHIYLGKPELKSPTLTNKLILKMSHPDASHLYITIEEILRKHRLRTTRRLHPIIGIKRNKDGKIIDIVQPDQSFERRSLVFIAFDQLMNPDLIKTIKKDLNFHMKCVQKSQEDSDAIFQQINFVTKQLQLLKPSISSAWVQLLSWLNDQNFSFFGCHVIERNGKKHVIKSGLGICQDSVKISELIGPDQHLLDHDNQEAFIVDRTTIMSPIQRFEPLMKVSFKFNTTQYIFYGILKRSSMYAKNIDTPLINKKMEFIFNERRFLSGSYDYNEVIRIFNDVPKFELFRTTQEDLLEMVDFIMSITNPNHIQCFKKYQHASKQLKLYFVIPYYLFGPKTVKIISEYICSQLDYSFHEILPITAPEKCRIHFHFKLNTIDALPDEEPLERTLTSLVQPWEDQVRHHIMNNAPEILMNDPGIVEKIPSHYKVRTKPASAVRDIQRLLNLSDTSPILFELFSFDFPTTSDLAGKASMLLVYHRTKLNLTNILPILHNLGIHVIDQITSRFGDASSTIGYILAFRLLDSNLAKLDEEHVEKRLISTLTDVFEERLPNDPLNQLILSSELTASDIFILQGLRNYMGQVFLSNYSFASINQVLNEHPKFSENLITLFKSKFNPKNSQDKRLSAIISATDALNKYIKAVTQVIEDQILRRFLSIVIACVRTNFYIKDATDALSFKFNCKEIFGISTPIPFRETFVFDYHLEGVHIRFGAIARGGLRWSNRLDDYRTEVLGLVKTQQTKNAVIIPVGSKGGFVIKNAQQPSAYDDGVAQYKRFITAMLHLTDNLVGGKKSVTKGLISYDDFDPYFVVAADKGTAAFSDFANSVSINKHFWLGDGFASGGQFGYDHKKVGITAKGAWECTKLHFKAMQQNPEKDPIKVVAVGDMSGDVFGNGMLLSQSIHLIAAFNHMHIFIDPNPDSKTSWKERSRLFKMDRSSWTDYQGISKGGGIFDRSAKEIQCTKEIQELFGIKENTLTGEELIKAILTSNVDLIWFGGIGTYIKADSESNIDVGDPSNNSVRVNASDVCAKVISEGANLAITQKGRIQYELVSGGRINTDAIDNSAGVNMSDYEVNIKILLSTLQTKKVIKTESARNKILEKATDEVTELVLNNNTLQHNLISMDQFRSKTQPFLIDYTISELIKLGLLNHIDEQIPTSKERQELYKQNISLPRPVLAKCQAYVKMRIKDALNDSTLFNGPLYDDIFYHYFPVSIQKLTAKKDFPDHRLKKQIIITQLTNYFVGLFGCASVDFITFSNEIPMDKAIHQLVLLEEIFNIKSTRDTYFKEWVTDDDYGPIFELNRSLLHANLICYLLDLNLMPKKIPHYQTVLHELSSTQWPTSILCLFLNHKAPSDLLAQLNAIESCTGLISNIQLIESLPVSKHVMHTQKTSVLSDLFFCLKELLSLPNPTIQSVATDPTRQLNPVSGTKDTLANLFLYSFRLRQFLNSTKHS
tara:strand:+ start:5355 stop:9896 length:4542 start_codon:yes stop_codon:yes gene_type:complete